MKRFANKKNKIKNLSEVQSEVIKEFLFEAGYQVKFITGTPAYLKELPLLLKDSDITIIDVSEDFTPLSPFLNILSHFKVSEAVLMTIVIFRKKRLSEPFYRLEVQKFVRMFL